MAITVSCWPAAGGHQCRVEVSDNNSVSSHSVVVNAEDLARWGAGRSVDELVRRSFEFLLQREPKESILRKFDLALIQRYFPEFGAVITKRS
jgi:hypothetical protein